jgi:hypothetical protein
VNAFVDKLPVDDGFIVPLTPNGGQSNGSQNPPQTTVQTQVTPVSPPVTAPVSAPATTPPIAPAPVQQAGAPVQWMPWITTGGGVLVAVVGGNLFLVAQGVENRLRAYEPPRTPQHIQEMRKLQGEEQAWRTTGTILVAAGLATAAGGGAWLFLSRQPGKPAVSVLPLPGGAVVSGSF